MLTNSLAAALLEFSCLWIFVVLTPSAAAGIVTIHFLTVTDSRMGTSISPSVTPGPQKDPSAERNAVPRKAKVISKLTD